VDGVQCPQHRRLKRRRRCEDATIRVHERDSTQNRPGPSARDPPKPGTPQRRGTSVNASVLETRSPCSRRKFNNAADSGSRTTSFTSADESR
jgi:hypothetical protein